MECECILMTLSTRSNLSTYFNVLSKHVNKLCCYGLILCMKKMIKFCADHLFIYFIHTTVYFENFLSAFHSAVKPYQCQGDEACCKLLANTCSHTCYWIFRQADGCFHKVRLVHTDPTAFSATHPTVTLA